VDVTKMEARVPLGTYEVWDESWSVSGTVMADEAFSTALHRLSVQFQLRSGKGFEEAAAVMVAKDGTFHFKGKRLLLSPGPTVEAFLTILDQSGLEIGRFYHAATEAEIASRSFQDFRIRVGTPFLDVWQGLSKAHPERAARLETLRFEPKEAHRGEDKWFELRRWPLFGKFQVAEGIVEAGPGETPGDPDLMWDVRLDPIYLGLRNSRNRDACIHVEACNAVGLFPQKQEAPVPNERVWMLGTHVLDHTFDFGFPGHEHNELHPLYVMSRSLGGWFHFAVAESIAIAPEAAQVTGAPPREWPWTSLDGKDYRAAYLKHVTLNPSSVLDRLQLSYASILRGMQQ
jgi:hypothetical protein